MLELFTRYAGNLLGSTWGFVQRRPEGDLAQLACMPAMHKLETDLVKLYRIILLDVVGWLDLLHDSWRTQAIA
jgi:hypothetical protein